MSVPNFIRYLLAGVAVSLAVVPDGSAQAAQEITIYLSAQEITWKEFDDAGARLLKESGPLFGIGGIFRYQEDNSKFVLRIQGEFFGGQTDYDGQEPGTPTPSPRFLTDVTYFGSQWQGDIGWDLKIGEHISLIPFGGGGMRWWLRSLDESYSADGTLRNDYTEFWTGTFVKAGLRCEIGFGDTAAGQVFVESSVRVPVFTQVEVLSGEDYDPEVNPRSAPSLYAETGIRIGIVRASVFYEGLRFYRSKKQTDELGFAHYQPKSEADIVGIRVGVVF